MAVDDRVNALESEFKLIKGELKETLASVRDYLTSFKLPPPGDAEFLKYIDGEDEQKVTMAGSINHSSDVSIVEPPPSRSARSGESSMAAGEPDGSSPVDVPDSPAEVRASPAGVTSQVESAGSAGDVSMGEAEQLEPPAGYGYVSGKSDGGGCEGWSNVPAEREEMAEWTAAPKGREEESYSAPRVNMLSNLIRWVSNAKREIGEEQLASFLEVYGISGHLSPELKEVILHLVEITEPSSEDASTAEIWSKLILELHGILTGGDTPMHVVKPLWDDASEEAQLEEAGVAGSVAPDRPEEKPLKLKLVFTNGDGKEREFSLNLDPEVDRESPSGRPSSTSEIN